jgi:hypothetical protein
MGAGCAIVTAMAIAVPSRGVADPAARLAVRDPGMMLLGPGGEVRGGVAVPVHHQPATVAAKGPLGQPHSLLEGPAARTTLGRWEPAVGDQHLPAPPHLLVVELAGELRPAGIGDGAGQVLVADEVGDGEVFQAQPVVGLDEPAGDLM